MDILILTSRISEKIAILANMLADGKKVLLISPIYETSSGIELTPEHLLGKPLY